jgi:hypothetical protein
MRNITISDEACRPTRARAANQATPLASELGFFTVSL